MRNNQPVTQQEHILGPELLLVSKTDLHGTIIYANEDFVEASGYPYDEIMGQPHNILRHPDVPEHVFADLWETIQAGRPWRQIVKNRRKNGDHYWVEANTSPIYENGEHIGYLSVRRTASEQQKKDAEAAYNAIREGKAKLRNGQVDSLWVRFNPFAHWNPLVTIIPATIVALIAGITDLVANETPWWLNSTTLFLTVLSTIHILYYLGRIKDAIHAVNSIGGGNYFGFIDIHGENSSGEVNRQIQNLQTRLGAQMNEVSVTMKRSQRLSAGLDNQKAMMMLADQNGTIIYLNAALKGFLQERYDLIKQEVPDFETDKLLGKSTGCLFKQDLTLLEQVLNLSSAKHFNFDFFGAKVGLFATPITSNGQKLGIVLEWQDIYQQQYVETNFKNIVEAAREGRLHSRMETSGLEGFYKEMGDSINNLMENLQHAMTDISIMVSSLSDKDLTIQPEHSHSGQYKWSVDNLLKGLDSLRESFCGAAHLAQEVHQTAGSVSESNANLSSSIKDQVHELQLTSQAMNAITEKVEATSQQARQANELAQKTQHDIEQGNRNMSEAVNAMSEIQQVSEQITGIVSLIDSIAFQTNLLALNAAVEAARAGEHGRGFAVVAGEVRSLAQRSADAAREIKGLIDLTAEKISDGSEKVVNTSETLQAIIRQVEDMTVGIATISENAHHQSQEIVQIGRSIEQIDQAAMTNSTLVMDNSSLSVYLKDVATTMDELVSSFELGECDTDFGHHRRDKNKPLVMVVDDNLSNQKVAEMVLQKFGYETIDAEDGQMALSRLERFKPEAILMDIEMPKMDGWAATQRIRASGHKMPIFAYTGHENGEIQKCYDIGMQDILHKPLKPSELKSILEKHNVHGKPDEKKLLEEKRKKIIQKSPLAKKFHEMIQAHLAWKARIRRFISGAEIGVSYEAAIDHTACALGKWYYSEGQAFMNSNIMQTLGVEHEKMHQSIKTIMDAFEHDDYEAMESAVHQLDDYSDTVVELLNQMILEQG